LDQQFVFATGSHVVAQSFMAMDRIFPGVKPPPSVISSRADALICDRTALKNRPADDKYYWRFVRDESFLQAILGVRLSH
jgi:hypothetical protein